MNNQKQIGGVLTLLPTPFTEDGDLDINAVRDSVSYLESTGMHGIIVASGVGEFYTLNNEEFKELASAARNSCRNMLCIINCAYQNMTVTIDRVKYAESIGADCAMVYLYHYTQNSPELYEKYFEVLHEQTENIRFMILNDARESKGNRIPVDLFSRLTANYPRIAVFVEDIVNGSEMEMIQLVELFNKFGDRVSMIARSEAGMLVNMAIGGNGCLATYGLAMPKFLLSFFQKCESKDYDGALKDYQTLTRFPWESNLVGVNLPGKSNPLFPGTFTTLIGNTHALTAEKVGTIFPGTPATCKAMAEAVGHRVGSLRAPLPPLTPQIREFAKKWLIDINK